MPISEILQYTLYSLLGLGFVAIIFPIRIRVKAPDFQVLLKFFSVFEVVLYPSKFFTKKEKAAPEPSKKAPKEKKKPSQEAPQSEPKKKKGIK